MCVMLLTYWTTYKIGLLAKHIANPCEYLYWIKKNLHNSLVQCEVQGIYLHV